MPIKIAKCTCANDFQDQQYGKQNRVANVTKKQDGRVCRCTSCGKEVLVGGEK